METNTICRQCGGKCKPSKGFINYHNIQYPYDGSKAEFENRLEDCLKCENCGHSWINGKAETTTNKQDNKKIAVVFDELNEKSGTNCPMCGTACTIGGNGTTHFYIPSQPKEEALINKFFYYLKYNKGIDTLEYSFMNDFKQHYSLKN